MSLFDVLLATKSEMGTVPLLNLPRMLEKARESGSLAVLDALPGPWKAAESEEEKLSCFHTSQQSLLSGSDVFQWAKYQLAYGDQGLSSNIAVPMVLAKGQGTGRAFFTGARVIVANPSDAERISRTHVRKENNFEGILFSSVISTTDNDHWINQRRHLAEAFLPMSSLGEILPVSNARARQCADRLAEASAGGVAVDLSDFLLHEAQAQLQLALLGAPESLMDATNEEIRATFMGDPTSNHAKVGALGGAMKELMKIAASDKTLALPTDGCPVRGPLSRAVQTSNMDMATNYGNMLLILFAGHDTTGHTMTWLLFELARHPDIQRQVIEEVDSFFSGAGRPRCDVSRPITSAHFGSLHY
jgi:cytochrome P450